MDSYKLNEVIINSLSVLGYMVETKDGFYPIEETGFRNSVFSLEPYCWCDGTIHQEECPPNFIHKATGYSVSWYKHLGRGMHSDDIELKEWFRIFNECVASLDL